MAMAAVVIASAAAHAGVNLTVRGDYVNTPKFDGRSGTEVQGSSIFKGTYARMSFDGKVGEATVNGRLNLASADTYNGDSLVEYLYISKGFGNGMTVRLGKLNSWTGGIESYMDDVADVYSLTLANGGRGGNTSLQMGSISNASALSAGSISTPTPAGDSRGIGLNYTMGDHQIDAVVTNASNHGASNATSAGPTYKRNNMGLMYMGSFADKMVMPVFTYMIGAADEGTNGGVTTGYEEKQMSLGAKMNFSGLGLIVEYLANAKKDMTPSTGKEDNVTSVYALVDYKVDMWKPFLKYESSEFKKSDDSSNANSFKRTGVNVGVEIMPKADDAFRYHVSYATTSDKYGSTSGAQKETVSWSQMMVGVKYSADLLK